MSSFQPPSITMQESLTYTTELERVLRTRDPKQLQELMVRYATWFPPDVVQGVQSDLHVTEIMLHKLTCAHPWLEDLRDESRRWLTERGYSEQIMPE